MSDPGEEGTGGTGQGAELESEFSIAQSNALVPLLLIAAVTVLVLLAVTVRSRPVIPPVGAPADRAYSPKDFPEVFKALDALTVKETGPELARAMFPVPPPPFTEGIFPCMSCHETFPPNPARRPLEAMHSDIVFQHDAEHRWCLDCHDATDRNQLRLANGSLVPFTESYRLCGQCHGTQFRDWRTGIHGKRTGYWDGPKRYLLCVHCHNPHSPRFAALQPLPPPLRPQYLAAGEVETVQGQAARPAGKETGDGAQAH
jgi:hypothetical protein